MSDSQPSLGEYLRSEREKRGITIEQLASATKISVKVLHSLEADHYVDLPAKPFIRGFVTSYARFIGLDPKEVLIRFADFVEDRARERPSRDAGHSGYAFDKRETEESRTILWFVMGGFILFGGIAFLVFKPKLKHHHGSHVEKLREAYPSPSVSPLSGSPLPSGAPSTEPSGVIPAVSDATPSASSTPSASPSPSPSPTVTNKAKAASSVIPLLVAAPPPPVATPDAAPSAAPSPGASPGPLPSASPNPKDPLNSGRNLKSSAVKYKVVIRASVSVPVRYQLDDRPLMKLNLGQEKVLTLKAQEHIYFQVAHSAAIELSYNGGVSESVKDAPNAFKTARGMVLIFPPQLAETVKDPFGSEPPLGWGPKPSAPSPEAPSAIQP
jgi:cytoskeleton protein RodZ